MTPNQTQYLTLAAAARTAADGEKLDNVRQKHLTSAASWEGLAHSMAKMGELREQRAKDVLEALGPLG
jgi:uncharacterized ferredoxin-like protein